MKHILPLIFTVLATTAHAGVITLVAQQRDGVTGVAELPIGPFGVAELLSLTPTLGCGIARLEIIKDGATATYGGYASGQTPFTPLVVAGPAILRLTISKNFGCGSSNPDVVTCTFRTSPEAFPPDRTMIVLPGTNQTSVTLECSTNLIDWTSATNGVYGPMPEAKFFRINLLKQ
jgi:hypothetical protein